MFFFFFFNDTATTEIYTLSLHDALPISYNWDFGDAIGTSTAANPIYTYTTVGLFKVWLVVTNGLCVDSATSNIQVINRSEEHTSELQSH